MAIKPSSE
jgi:WD40 repeat protein